MRLVIFVSLISFLLAPLRLHAAEKEYSLDQICLISRSTGDQEWVTGTRMKTISAASTNVSFRAVISEAWPPGLIPVFAVERPGGVQLWLRAPRGEENSREPLFFALHGATNSEVEKISGHWTCEAVRADSSKAYFGWDLTLHAGAIHGRFEQGTDYRFAHLVGGTFRSNRLELQIQYIMDAYVARGTWRDDQLSGTWAHEDGSESGPWKASRAARLALPKLSTVRVFEWKANEGDQRRYELEETTPGAGWTKSPEPLFRVWRESPSKAPTK